MLATASIPAAHRIMVRQEKADWRAAGGWLGSNATGRPVVVVPPGPGPNFELVVARYYARGDRQILEGIRGLGEGRAFCSMSLRDGVPLGALPESSRYDLHFGETRDFSQTLRLVELWIMPMDDRPRVEWEPGHGK